MITDGFPKGELLSPFCRSRCRNTGPGFQGVAMLTLVDGGPGGEPKSPLVGMQHRNVARE